MRIHEDVESILLCFAQHIDGMLDPLFIVFAGPSSLDRLPSKYIADGVIAVPLQSGKVYVRVFLPKWSAVKFDVVAIEEVLGDVGGHIWRAGEFRVTSNVDSAE